MWRENIHLLQNYSRASTIQADDTTVHRFWYQSSFNCEVQGTHPTMHTLRLYFLPEELKTQTAFKFVQYGAKQFRERQTPE
jgi:hypothetical protein